MMSHVLSFVLCSLTCSAHQKAHMIADQKQEGLKWPWEKVLNIGLDEVSDANNQSGGEADGYTNPDLYHKLK